tara:strand:+ start:4556 stop:5317 length:762 start_codon:yes stop_codon:yes gene_type:complete
MYFGMFESLQSDLANARAADRARGRNIFNLAAHPKNGFNAEVVREYCTYLKQEFDTIEDRILKHRLKCNFNDTAPYPLRDNLHNTWGRDGVETVRFFTRGMIRSDVIHDMLINLEGNLDILKTAKPKDDVSLPTRGNEILGYKDYTPRNKALVMAEMLEVAARVKWVCNLASQHAAQGVYRDNMNLIEDIVEVYKKVTSSIGENVLRLDKNAIRALQNTAIGQNAALTRQHATQLKSFADGHLRPAPTAGFKH